MPSGLVLMRRMITIRRGFNYYNQVAQHHTKMRCDDLADGRRFTTAATIASEVLPKFSESLLQLVKHRQCSLTLDTRQLTKGPTPAAQSSLIVGARSLDIILTTACKHR